MSLAQKFKKLVFMWAAGGAVGSAIGIGAATIANQNIERALNDYQHILRGNSDLISQHSFWTPRIDPHFVLPTASEGFNACSRAIMHTSQRAFDLSACADASRNRTDYRPMIIWEDTAQFLRVTDNLYVPNVLGI